MKPFQLVILYESSDFAFCKHKSIYWIDCIPFITDDLSVTSIFHLYGDEGKKISACHSIEFDDIKVVWKSKCKNLSEREWEKKYKQTFCFDKN